MDGGNQIVLYYRYSGPRIPSFDPEIGIGDLLMITLGHSEDGDGDTTQHRYIIYTRS